MKKTLKFIKLCEEYGVDPDLVPEVLSFEAACKKQKLDPAKLPIIKGSHRNRIIADYKLSVIADSLRNGWKPDYTDYSQYKYHALFEVIADDKKPSGSGLACNDFVGWYSYSFVGVRLCFPNRDTAKFFGKHFIALHTDHHLLT